MIAQSLYAVGALLCLIGTRWSIGFIFLVQLCMQLRRENSRSMAIRAGWDVWTASTIPVRACVLLFQVER